MRRHYRDVTDIEAFLRLRIQLFDQVTVIGHRQVRFDWARLASLLVEKKRFAEARVAAQRAQQICLDWQVDGDEIDRGMDRLLNTLPES